MEENPYKVKFVNNTIEVGNAIFEGFHETNFR